MILLTTLVSLITISPLMAMEKSGSRPGAFPAVFIYSHGLNSNPLKAQEYIKAKVLDSLALAVTYQDALWNVGTTSLYMFNSAVGQKDDIEALNKFISDHADGKDIVGYGESRGAATLISLLAGRLAKIDNIKAVVLDSPFAHMRSVLAHLIKQFHLDYLVTSSTAEKIFGWVCRKYNPQGIQPISGIETFPDTPTLFICSKEDMLIPFTESIELYKKLRSLGRMKVHILILKQGKHGWLMIGPCAHVYKIIVNAFYKFYGIAHDPTLADLGMELFISKCQPSQEEVDSLELGNGSHKPFANRRTIL